MKPDVDSALDTLARFVQVIGRDSTLRQPFCALASLSPVQRSNEILLMAAQMAAEGRDPELAAAFRLFSDPRVFEAGMAALRECGYIIEVIGASGGRLALMAIGARKGAGIARFRRSV